MGKTLEITGDGLKMIVTQAFAASSAKRKGPGRTTHGTVILCKIKTGKVIPGEKINLLLPDKELITDTVVRVEENKEGINFGSSGQEVGVCLANTHIKEISSYLS